MPRRSVATIDNPEFINVSSISPLISKCEIKVLYVGENRNRSFITKEVATQMAETLPGCPIVGYYIENKKDFGDHGDQMIIDGEGIKFNTLTKPYGFVAPDSKIWFKKFEDTDEFGNSVVREYLMTEGYLWTGQFEEAKRVVDCGNPQSMELDSETLEGHWATNNKSGVEFFIINDAMFSKLCILGEDVEPCFEGASVTAPDVSSRFSKDDKFTTTLFSMMNELKFTLKGGETVEQVENSVVEETPTVTENFSNEQDKFDKTVELENQNITEEFAKKEATSTDHDDYPDEEENEDAPSTGENQDTSSEDNVDDSTTDGGTDAPSEDFACGDKKKEYAEDEKKEEKKEDQKEEKDKEEDPEKKDKEDKEEEDKEKKFSLLEQNYSELENKYSQLEKEYQELLSFKLGIESKQKDELIAEFYMLSDEDKKNVIENKDKYSLDEIKKELCVICVDKKVNFDANEKDNTEKEVAVTFNLNDAGVDATIPAWLRAVEATRNRIR